MKSCVNPRNSLWARQVTYLETMDHSNGTLMDATHHFPLLDPRFYGERRHVTFDRSTEDIGKVQGMLRLTAAVQ